MDEIDIPKTESCECKICGCDYLAFANTKEFKVKICYRCFMNGLADSFLAEKQDKDNVILCKGEENIGGIN